MFQETTKHSHIIKILSEESSEEGDTHKLCVRVLNQSKWEDMMYKILVASDEKEDFGVSIRKEFYLNEDKKPSFIWSILLWGDLDSSVDELTPIFSKRGAPPPPPKSLGVSVPVSRSAPVKAQVSADGTITKKVALPHKRGSRNKDPNTVIRIGDNSHKGIRATVSNLGG